MNWIAAYINAVKTNLPKKQKEDIGEELQTLLEESFVRDLEKQPEESSEAEVLEWIRKREHPALVAARYYERRNLVDEDSFPLFKITLQYVFYGLCVAYVSIALLRAFTTGDYTLSLTNLAGNILHSGLIAFACVTLIFYFFGSKIASKDLLSNWNPKDLPNPDNKWEQTPWSDSISSLVFTTVFLLLINGFLGHIAQTIGGQRFEGVQLNIVDHVRAHLPAINAVLIGSILLYAFMLFKPYWSTLTLSTNLILNLATAVIAYQLTNYDSFVAIASGSLDSAAELPKFIGMINTSIRVALFIVLIISLYEMARGAYRLNQLGTRRLV